VVAAESWIRCPCPPTRRRHPRTFRCPRRHRALCRPRHCRGRNQSLRRSKLLHRQLKRLRSRATFQSEV